MTTTSASPTAPDFAIHSNRAALLRGLCLLALCSALTGGFLAAVWSAPAASDASTAAAATTGPATAGL